MARWRQTFTIRFTESVNNFAASGRRHVRFGGIHEARLTTAVESNGELRTSILVDQPPEIDAVLATQPAEELLLATPGEIGERLLRFN